jgi:Cu(I)/Ag(I) efflux system membrane protein CusA/SilA
MIGAVIRWSIANRFIVVLLALVLGASGIWALRTPPPWTLFLTCPKCR